ncbi:MAG: hypothetical protein AAGJ18_00795, partial [Bacteroidota bacterium]
SKMDTCFNIFQLSESNEHIPILTKADFQRIKGCLSFTLPALSVKFLCLSGGNYDYPNFLGTPFLKFALQPPIAT